MTIRQAITNALRDPLDRGWAIFAGDLLVILIISGAFIACAIFAGA